MSSRRQNGAGLASKENNPFFLNQEQSSSKQGKPTIPLGEIKNKAIIDSSEPKTPTEEYDAIDANQEPLSFNEASEMAKEQFEQETLKEHTVEYESHFPELGTKVQEAEEPESEFTPEILDKEVVTANINPDVEPVNIVEALSHKEMDSKELEKVLASQIEENIRHFEKGSVVEGTEIEQPSIKGTWEELKRKQDAMFSLAQAPDFLPEDPSEPKTPLETEVIFGIPIDTIGDKEKPITFSDLLPLANVQEHVVEYESHFPELGAKVTKATEPETEFATEILDAETATAMIHSEVEPVNVTAILAHEKVPETTHESRDTDEPHRVMPGSWEELKKRQELTFPLYLAKDQVSEDAEEPRTPKKLDSIFGVPVSSIGDQEGPITFSDIFALANQYLDRQILKEHVVEYESHFPELGAVITKADEPETSFTPNLLEKETVALTADVHSDIKPVNITAILAHEEYKIKELPKTRKSDGHIEGTWEALQKKQEAEAESRQGYKILKNTDYEEAEIKGLLSHQQRVGNEGEDNRDFGSYKTGFEKKRGKAKKVAFKLSPPADDLQPIEEDIVIEEDQDNLGDETPKDSAKLMRASLDHLGDDQPIGNMSTELTLSTQRIDLIREELKGELKYATSKPSTKNEAIQEVEKSLLVVQGLEKNRMYGAAVNLLKRSLESLDAQLSKHYNIDIEETNKLLTECNIHLAYCFSQLNEPRYSVDHARAALNLDSRNIKAMYILGTSLLKAGDQLGGYSVLKEAKLVSAPGLDDEDYLKLIDFEVKRYESRIRNTPTAEPKMVLPVLRTTAEPTLTPIKTIEVKKETQTSIYSNLGYFVGAAATSGLASWFVSKNYFNYSEKKSLAVSIGIGALVGGMSLAIIGHTRAAPVSK